MSACLNLLAVLLFTLLLLMQDADGFLCCQGTLWLMYSCCLQVLFCRGAPQIVRLQGIVVNNTTVVMLEGKNMGSFSRKKTLLEGKSFPVAGLFFVPCVHKTQ